MVHVKRLQKTQNSVIWVMSRNSKYMSIRVMLARNKMFSGMNQIRYQIQELACQQIKKIKK